MISIPKILAIYFICLALSGCGIEKRDQVFFPGSVVSQINTDLNGFLKKIGQPQRAQRMREYSQNEKIVLFIKDPFSVEKTREISELKSPFFLLETLDIIAHNLKMTSSFSDWYLSHLFVLVKHKPELYLNSFLRLCLKSDGQYAEWFADPLLEVMQLYPKMFFQEANRLDLSDRICSIFSTGKRGLVIDWLNNSSNEINSHLSTVRLLNCLKRSERGS